MIWVMHEGKVRQVKKGYIHEPKGRRKSFRAEIRVGTEKKIWLRSSRTRAKAQRAFDAARYYTGKQPYFHVYPEGYFLPCPSLKDFAVLKTFVKEKAEEYAERDDPLPVNPASLVPEGMEKGEPPDTSSALSSTRVDDFLLALPPTEHVTVYPLVPGVAPISDLLQDKLPSKLTPEHEPPDGVYRDWMLVKEGKPCFPSMITVETNGYDGAELVDNSRRFHDHYL